MSEIVNTYNKPIPNLSFRKNETDNSNPDLNIKAHYSDNMKVTRKRLSSASPPPNLPNQNLVQKVNKEADDQIKLINNDIYEGATKERSKHAFNKVLYFKIFGGITIAAIIVACMRKFKK